MTAHEVNPESTSIVQPEASNPEAIEHAAAEKERLRCSRRRRNSRGGGRGHGGGSLVSDPRDKIAREPGMGLLLLVAGALGLAMNYFFN